jgi:hypothetical protein
MQKYEIVKNELDSYTLKYKDKSFEFHSDIDLKRKMQGVYKTARLKMLKDLSSEGISLKSFTMEEKKGGKTYYDNTNKKELEQAYIDEETANVFNNICQDNFGMDFTDLITDIGLEEDEIEEFSKELAQALNGNFPSGGNKS